MNRDIYATYKSSFNLAERRKSWIKDKSFIGIAKRATSEIADLICYGVSDTTQERTESILLAPKQNLKRNELNFRAYEELVQLDAIQDAIAANVELDPETVAQLKS